MDVRAAILREMRRQKVDKAWLVRTTGIRAGTIYDYLNGRNDMMGETINKVLKALKLEIRPKR